MKLRLLLLGVWLILGCWLVAAPAEAHLLNMTKVKVEVDTKGLVTATIEADLTKASGGGENYYGFSLLDKPLQNERFGELLSTLENAFVFTSHNKQIDWHLTQVGFSSASEEDYTSGLAWPMTTVIFTGQLSEQFEQSSITLLFNDTFKFEEPIAVTIDFNQGERRQSRWLVRNQSLPAFYFTPTTAPSRPLAASLSTWLSYCWQGVKHIIPFGWDHALFVLGLFFGVSHYRHLLLMVSGFTLAHTITLGLATFGAVVVKASVIEPLIALSIVWIAIENLVVTPRLWWRFTIVVGFGLIHGLGFAEALKALGLPSSGFIGALVSFNIGVELAQLMVILLAWLLMRLWTSKPEVQRYLKLYGSAAISVVAMYWLIARLL